MRLLFHCSGPYWFLRIASIAELGPLREVLRVSPDVAQHVRSFTFSWKMDSDFYRYDDYPEEADTLLDMAFRNRAQGWLDLRERLGCEAQTIEEAPVDELIGTHKYYFVHNDIKYFQPRVRRSSLKDVNLAVPDGRAFLAEASISGPDGGGEDLLIHSVEDFKDCMGEIVEQLSMLQTFEWRTPVTSFRREHSTLSKDFQHSRLCTSASQFSEQKPIAVSSLLRTLTLSWG